ncbi:phosphoenolpyruvate carboxylase [Nitrospirillum sp. BR 11828]|uniref:phosphoenolpyruvate carboxylase n=1 Tax=Nitrospirillum sp. BR 11828 TaxID=3104325 RepID=UPI002ACA91A5|nr:phosphoenolpyruvate carboxylase [Nitrospirillum sp. BR 11828]MDZ5649702.1 phosphoenolpyruvate carboxylase [Nitrospirillum sp. BR 11828]
MSKPSSAKTASTKTGSAPAATATPGVDVKAADAATLATLAKAGALLARPVAKFAATGGAATDAVGLTADLVARLSRYTELADADPFANPVSLLALDVSRRLHSGELDLAAVEQAIQYLGAEGFLARARRLGAYLGEADPAANAARIRALIDGLAVGADGKAVPFDAFRAQVEKEIFGIVITAHPTFNLTGELMDAMAKLATGRDAAGVPLTAEARKALIAAVAATELRPGELSLVDEHRLSLAAITNIQAALRTVYDIVLSVAQDRYPDQWAELTPRLLTVASWVGYDLDGRSDIRWSDTLHKRLVVQVGQLRHYLAEVQAIRKAAPVQEDLRNTLDLLESRLALAIAQVTDEVAAFGRETTTQKDIEAIAQRMHEGLPLRLVEAAHAIEQVDRAIRLATAAGTGKDRKGDDVVRRLAILKAELSNYGLGQAHTHVRINATQLHNAVRKTVGMETAPDDPRYRQSYLNAITGLLDEVRPVRINFGSIIAERTSAKRLFMVVAQMLKYADASVPVRFLIAESESAFTVLTALYYARLFGVADKVDISPLFETERALEVGSRVIEQLLDNPHYRDYVKRRGRLCIQTGFSDAGRYLGQTPASASIERLRLRIARLFTRHRLDGVQLVIFDTHGESIGRGAHPAGFPERLGYVAAPATLSFMAHHKIAFKQEVSFQGGDGYLYFVTQPGALAVVTRILEHMLGGKHTTLDDDPFYGDADYIREFFTTVKQFQVSLVEDPNYGALLSALGTNLLYPSGSRAIKRQHDGNADDVDQSRASQFRAIPHNAILQQMGLPANTVSGVGEAIDKDPEHFAELYRTSPRFRQLLGMVEYGVAIASPDALKAYIDTLDPAFWLLRAAHTADPARVEEMRRLAAILEDNPLHSRLIRIFRKLYRDFDVLEEGLARVERHPVPGQVAPPDEALSNGLLVLHALRIALIQEVFLRATHIPQFSSQHNITHRRLMARLMQLDVPWALDLLSRIFPVAETAGEGDFGESATYVSDDSQNYGQENERIFKPIASLYDLVRRVGNGITQRIGFFG